MSRFSRFLILAVAACGFALPLAASAADPVPTTTRVFVGDTAGPTTQVTVRVSASSGRPTGSVVLFTSAGTEPLGDPVVLDASGTAVQTVPTSTGFSPYRAEFTGTGAYASSTGSVNPFGESVKMVGQGTILHIGGPGLLRLTVKFAARATYASDGTPAVGETIVFTQRNKARGASGHPEMDPNYVYPVQVCTAVVDATGYASCTGTPAMASIITLLTTPSYANHELFPIYESKLLPPVGIG